MKDNDAEAQLAQPATPRSWGVLTYDQLACLSCGIAVAWSSARSVVTFTPWGRADPLRGRSRGGQGPQPVEMTRCGDCQRHADLAADLVARHPVFSARIGTDASARLEAVVRAFALVGKPVPESRADLWLAVGYLAGPADDARFAMRAAPVAHAGWLHGQCALAPWSHLSAEHRRALDAGYVQMFADRLRREAPRRRVECPTGACLMCGVGAVPVEGGEGRPWRGANVTAASLGGIDARRVRGHICALCFEVVESVGELDRQALQRAYRQARGHAASAPVVGHAVSERSREPNERPWAHVAERGAPRSAVGR